MNSTAFYCFFSHLSVECSINIRRLFITFYCMLFSALYIYVFSKLYSGGRGISCSLFLSNRSFIFSFSFPFESLFIWQYLVIRNLHQEKAKEGKVPRSLQATSIQRPYAHTQRLRVCDKESRSARRTLKELGGAEERPGEVGSVLLSGFLPWYV
jgi:hypothetical protein